MMFWVLTLLAGLVMLVAFVLVTAANDYNDPHSN